MRCKFCRKNGTSVIRGVEMCDLHYSIFKRDNSYRINRDIPTDDFKIYRECKTYVCKNKNISKLNDKIKVYCDKCKNKNLIRL